MGTLHLVLEYLLATVLGVVACRTLRLPPVLAYLLVGVLLGPYTLALGNSQETAPLHHLAGFGVVFLMFVTGLEFNLPKLHSMRRFVFGLGGLQVLLTIAAVMGVALALAGWLPAHYRLSWQGALVVGGALAMSSTAIIIKLLQDRAEMASEHGRRAIGVLLFQDLAVVPLLVLIPALGSPPETLATAMAWAGVKAAFIIALLLVGGKRVMHWWLTLVAKRKSDELFILNILLITLGLAWLTQIAGLSMALGAFIAGMLIAETPYRHQVETDVRPFYDVLLSLFFITIGMMLDWRLVLHHPGLVLLLLGASLLIKLLIVLGLSRLLGDKPGLSLRTGLYLAQAGEFGFVLLNLAEQQHLLPPTLMNPLLASMVLSMMIAPLLIMQADRIIHALLRNEWMRQSLDLTAIAQRTIDAEGHVIICGYGRSGQNMAHLIETQGLQYVALDLDPDLVQKGVLAGQQVVFGDASRPQVLRAAGLARARGLAITYLDLQSSLKIISAVRAERPDLPIVVRTEDDSTLHVLQEAGATEVVPEAVEGAMLLGLHALVMMGVPVRQVVRIVQRQREARYTSLRGYFRGADEKAYAKGQAHLASITVEAGCFAEGHSLETLAFEERPVLCVDVRRDKRSIMGESDAVLQAGDVLILSGTPSDLAHEEARLLR